MTTGAPAEPVAPVAAAIDLPTGSDLLDRRAAQTLDARHGAGCLRDAFHVPTAPQGGPTRYFAGHSLGPQPREARTYVAAALDDWATLGVEGHLEGEHPWLPYHELLAPATARLVGAQPGEVVVMNTLTVNLHFLLVSFYRPRPGRFRILLEAGAFPSDRYALASHARLHGFDPADALVELAPRPGEATLHPADLVAAARREDLALVCLGNCNYLTGQAFSMAAITAAAHAQGTPVGFDLAHGAGNLVCDLHGAGPDFAVWCNYKYLNAGPGGLGGAFVHERWANTFELPRLQGWWGHDKASRFAMPADWRGLPGAEGWQVSNPPILQLAALRASMALFDRAGMPALRARGDVLTAYLECVLDHVGGGWLAQVTPRDPTQRGSMLTVRVRGDTAALAGWLRRQGAVVDLRPPDIVRVTPAPLYTTFDDVCQLGLLLAQWRDDHA
ncbi:MAG: kynureninase [Myxococcales bacterium]|nr:kynureninase [Myxococcales bacterium]